MKQSILTFALMAAMSTHGAMAQSAIPAHPVDPAVSQETSALYTRLYNAYGQQTLPCAMADVSWNYDLARQVNNLTGQWPVMNCFDLLHLCYSPCNWINYDDISPVSEWHQLGGITALMWHWQVPTVNPDGATPGATRFTSTASETEFSPANINTEGSWEHQLFYTDLWEAYTVLKQLQDAGIPVIWRPFHEAAGNVPNGGEAWFWWGKDGADVYRQLWHRMYSYFQDLGIHNLIWVWTSCENDPEWYPGDDVVDIIGTDSYNQDVLTLSQRYRELQQRYPNRMLALTECGQAPYVSVMQGQGAWWLWAMPWYGKSDAGQPWGTDAWWRDAISRYQGTSVIVSPAASSRSVPAAVYTLGGQLVGSRPAGGLAPCVVRRSDGTVRKAVLH